MASNKALRSGVGYTLGNVLIKGINFLTLPIFSRILSPEEFGVYTVFASYDTILFVIIGLALHTSIQSANFEFKGQINRYTSSVTLIYILNAVFLLAVAALFRQQLSQLLDIPPAAVILLILGSLSGAVITLYNTRISLDYSYKKYLLVSACNSLFNIGVSLLLMLTLFKDNRVMGRIIGSVLPQFVITLVLLFSFYRKAKPKPSKTYWRFGITYCLPIVPHGISQVLLSQCDRIMIRSLVNDAAAGIYSLAANLKLVLNIITDSIATAWNTWFYAQMGQENRQAIQKRATQLMLLFFALAVGMMAVSPELIWLLGGPEYTLGKYVAIPMMLDAFIQFLSNLIVPAEYYSKKTTYIMAGTMIASILNIALNYIFIRKFGFMAAAYTTLASYACYLALHYVISRKLVRFFVLPFRRMLGICTLIAGIAVWNLWFIDNLLLRWTMCAVVVIPVGCMLLRVIMQDKTHNQPAN